MSKLQPKSWREGRRMKTMHVDQHLERHLGRIAKGWGGYGGDLASMQVCLFEECPLPGTVTYATLGFSRHTLDMPKNRLVRQELLLSAGARHATDDFAKLLTYIAEMVLKDHRALLRGQVVPLRHPISRGSQCDSLYVSLPVVFPDGLATLSTTQPPTVFAWLIPISPTEADFVARNGWSKFEERLESEDPDLFDLGRTPIL